MRRPWFQTGLIAWQLVLVLGLSLAAEARSDRPRASTAPTERPEPELHKTLTEAPLLRVGQLLAHGANIEARDATGATPLITAAARGNITLIRLLLSRLARVDARDRDGDSALHLSSLAGCVDCVDALLQAGAPPDSRNTLGFTPLHQAVRRFWELPGETNRDRLHRQRDIIALLLQQGASLDSQDGSGRTPATLAMESNNGALRASLITREPAVESHQPESLSGNGQAPAPNQDRLETAVVPSGAGTSATAPIRQEPQPAVLQDSAAAQSPPIMQPEPPAATSPIPPAAAPSEQPPAAPSSSMPPSIEPATLADRSAKGATTQASRTTASDTGPQAQATETESRSDAQSQQALSGPDPAAPPGPVLSSPASAAPTLGASSGSFPLSPPVPAAASKPERSSVESASSEQQGDPAIQRTEPIEPSALAESVPATASQPLPQQPAPALERDRPTPSHRESTQTAQATGAAAVASAEPSEVSARPVPRDLQQEARVSEPSQSPWLFRNVGFGLGLGWTHNLGPRRIESVTTINRIVRIDEERNDLVRFMPELHVWLDRWDEQRWSWGPFLAFAPGSRVVDAVGFGLMLGYRPSPADHYSFNLGLGGVLDLDARVLGDGLIANEPLPPHESSARTKHTTAAGLLVLFSIGWDPAAPQGASRSSSSGPPLH
ncbi:MAG: ankyrin repeat domain-containing protein [Nitrospiraceae bacterium]|nr:ankyrin repeat domain-containing protein [Nitrospiraceae bacterium]